MAENVAIWYFTGTGNTRTVCELLRDALTERGHACTLFPVETYRDGGPPDMGPYTMVGIAHPVHAWDAPRIMHEFVRSVPAARHLRTFMLKTAGGYSSSNNGASFALIKKMQAKGYDVFYDRLICMPSNWLVKTADATAKRLYETARGKTAHMAGELTDGTRRTLPMSAPVHALMRMMFHMEDTAARFFGKDLRAGGECTRCGWCEKQCPMGNIRVTDRKVAFGWNCIMCMRCVYGCPQDAVNYRLYKPFRVKGGYDLKKLLRNESVIPAALDETTTGYDKQFVAYANDVSR